MLICIFYGPGKKSIFKDLSPLEQVPIVSTIAFSIVDTIGKKYTTFSYGLLKF